MKSAPKVLILVAAVFIFGHGCGAHSVKPEVRVVTEPAPEPEVITKTERVEVEVPVQVPLPEWCEQAVDAASSLRESDENITAPAGQIIDLVDDIQSSIASNDPVAMVPDIEALRAAKEAIALELQSRETLRDSADFALEQCTSAVADATP